MDVADAVGLGDDVARQVERRPEDPLLREVGAEHALRIVDEQARPAVAEDDRGRRRRVGAQRRLELERRGRAVADREAELAEDAGEPVRRRRVDAGDDAVRRVHGEPAAVGVRRGTSA